MALTGHRTRYYIWRLGFKMATALFGQMQEFQPGAEPITAYLERFTAYLDAHEIADDKRAPHARQCN